MQNDSCWFEWDICVSLGSLDPVEDGLDILGLYVELVAVSNSGLKENSDGVWQRIYEHSNEEKLEVVYDATYQV